MNAVGLGYLQQFISEDALYDSSTRFPPPRSHPGTRERVVQIITSWVDDPDPRQHILWLNGPAGAGKTAIAQTIAERCRDSEQLAGSFFFLRNATDHDVVDRLFLTLAWQLARSIPETCPYIESALEEEPLLHKKSIDVQFNRLFVKVFKQLRDGEPNWNPKNFLVIIDGVDECATERDQRTFLTLIIIVFKQTSGTLYRSFKWDWFLDDSTWSSPNSSDPEAVHHPPFPALLSSTTMSSDPDYILQLHPIALKHSGGPRPASRHIPIPRFPGSTTDPQSNPAPNVFS